MKLAWIIPLGLACARGGRATDPSAADEVSFSRQLAPVLVAKCASCHSQEKAKGGFRAHSFETLFQPGKSKLPSIVPAKPDESELLKRLTSSDEDERMPQKDEPLPPEQIDLFRQWIAQGAKLDQGSPKASLSSLAPRAPNPLPPERYSRPFPILALAFSPEGAQLASGGRNEILVWDTHGALQKRITNVAQRVHAIAFHPSEPYIAAAGGTPGRSGELSVYRASGELETNLVLAADELLTVAFSHDGKYLAGGGADNTVHLFNWETRQKLFAIQQHADWVTSIAFNSNGTRIASASRDRTARLYDVATGNLETTYAGHNAFVYVVDFLADGRVVSGGRDRSLHLWDSAEGKKKGELTDLPGEVYRVCSDDSALFVAGSEKLVRQYNAADRKVVRTFAGNTDALYALALTPAKRKLASGSYDGVIHIWDIDSGKLQTRFIAAPGFEPEH